MAVMVWGRVEGGAVRAYWERDCETRSTTPPARPARPSCPVPVEWRRLLSLAGAPAPSICHAWSDSAWWCRLAMAWPAQRVAVDVAGSVEWWWLRRATLDGWRVLVFEPWEMDVAAARDVCRALGVECRL